MPRKDSLYLFLGVAGFAVLAGVVLAQASFEDSNIFTFRFVVGIEAPRDLRARYSDTDKAELSWTNPQSYEKLEVYREPGPSGPITTFTSGGLLSKSEGERDKSFRDNGVNFDEVRTYTYRLKVYDRGQSAESNSASVSRINEIPYSLNCSRSFDNKTITVSWGGQLKKNHIIDLFDVTDGSSRKLYTKSAEQLSNNLYSAGGDFRHNGQLDPEKTYSYRLRISYTEGGVDWAPSMTGSLSCEPRVAPDAPSHLNAWAQSPSLLFVNWKDNAVRPHTFEVQRVKLTPNRPAFDVAEGLRRELIRTVDANKIHLNWKNNTNSSAKLCANGTTNGICKGPFYHYFERVHYLGEGRGDPKEGRLTSSPFVDANGRDISENDRTLQPVKKAFSEDVNPGSQTKTFYSADDSGLQEGTEYYYRLKACSFIKADLTKDDIDNPTDVCGKFTASPAFVATTTFPAAPTGLKFTSVTESSINFEWVDQSLREDGYEVRISPCVAGVACRGGQSIVDKPGTVTGTGRILTGSFNELFYGNIYDVSVYAYRNNRLGPGKVYSWPLTDSRMTFPRLTTQGVNGEIFPPPPDENNYFYSYDFARYSKPGDDPGVTKVTISAGGPDDSELFEFARLEGCGVAEGIFSCEVVMSENRDVRAIFRPINWRLTEINKCVTPTTSTSTITACEEGNIINCPDPAIPGGCDRKEVTGCSGNKVICGSTVTVTYKRNSGSLLPPGERNYVALPAKFSNPFKNLRAVAAGWLDSVKSVGRAAYNYLTALIRGVEKASAIVIKEPAIGDVSLTDTAVENYFKQFILDGQQLTGIAKQKIDLSTFEDTGLEADTVYMYRVRACYVDGGGCTTWSPEGAGKTLPSGLAEVDRNFLYGICVRNNLCERKTGVSYRGEKGESIQPENQCNTPKGGNAACRDVGTSRQFFEEVKPR